MSARTFGFFSGHWLMWKLLRSFAQPSATM